MTEKLRKRLFSEADTRHVDFVYGIEWYINGIWNNANENAERKPLLVKHKDGYIETIYPERYMDEELTLILSDVTSWAYLSDIIPENLEL